MGNGFGCSVVGNVSSETGTGNVGNVSSEKFPWERFILKRFVANGCSVEKCSVRSKREVERSAASPTSRCGPHPRARYKTRGGRAAHNEGMHATQQMRRFPPRLMQTSSELRWVRKIPFDSRRQCKPAKISICFKKKNRMIMTSPPPPPKKKEKGERFIFCILELQAPEMEGGRGRGRGGRGERGKKGGRERWEKATSPAPSAVVHLQRAGE